MRSGEGDYRKIGRRGMEVGRSRAQVAGKGEIWRMGLENHPDKENWTSIDFPKDT